MLCSICNKNTAVVFVNKPSSDGNNKLEGLCYECAKKKGINPIDTLVKQANLSETDIEDMTRQFEDMFKDISNNLDNVNPDDLGLNESGDLDGSSLGSIFSGIFNSNSDSTNSNSSQPDRKKIKVEKKNEACEAPFEEVKVKVMNEVAQKKREQVYSEKMTKLKEKFVEK